MYSALSKIGCHPTKNDDNKLLASYQGMNFLIEISGVYARVWEPSWAYAEANDKNLALIREAMNITNYSYGPIVVMSAPNEDGVFAVHSCYDIMPHPANPDNEKFVKDILDLFSKVKVEMHNTYQQLLKEQAETTKTQRPIGFAVTEEPAPKPEPEPDSVQAQTEKPQ